MFSVIVLADEMKPLYFVDKEKAMIAANAIAHYLDEAIFISASDENCFVVGTRD